MAKPILAILTDSIRYDNHLALRYFTKFKIVHFYHNSPYGDLTTKELSNAVKWDDFQDLEKKLLKLKPAIIQGSEPYASRRALRICLLTMRVARILGVPYIFPMLENRPVSERFGKITGYFLRRILQNYAKKAALIFYLNNGAKRNLQGVGANPKKMIKMLYGIWGIDTKVFRPEIKNFQPKAGRPRAEKLKIKNYVLYTGRIDEAKGIPYLLEAWNSIKKDFPGIELVFIGAGELSAKIKGDQIKKLDQMKVQDLPPYFANALFTVVPSVTLRKWEEQVGMVNLQSLACGTPVITTKSGAIPEYITSEVGFLVPERNAKALTEAMRNLLLDEKLRERLGRNGREYILANFDAQKTIEKIEKILLELV